MQKVPLSLAKSGMVLEKPVIRENGMTLVGVGTELTDSLLQRLENMGIESIIVEGSPLTSDGENSYAAKIERLDHLFRQYTQDKWMQKVKAALVACFEKKIAPVKGNAEEKKDE